MVASDLAGEINWEVPGADPKKIFDATIHDYHQDYKAFLDIMFDASSTIQVIDPHMKDGHEPHISMARTALTHAPVVYLLGYGFDANNSHRLLLEQALRYKSGNESKKVYFTNFGDSGRVSRRASLVFFGNPSHFNHNQPIAAPAEYQMSTRNVYQAFDLDFEID